jgi:5-methylcytosine-specific restriction enzyme subunit McrC
VIRYTPITESYRAIVELSLAIARQQPLSPSQEGHRDVFGVLIDMAEVWELYVYHLLRSLLVDNADVVHTGRARSPDSYLLASSVTGQNLGGLLPDIMIRNLRTGKCLAVVDAKYKTTVPGPDRPYGLVREDLYQMTAYLAAYRDASGPLPGALVFPGTTGSRNLEVLHAASPWRLAKTDCTMSFLGVACEATAGGSSSWTSSETALADSVRQMIAASEHTPAHHMRGLVSHVH